MGKLVNALLLMATIDLCMSLFMGVTTPSSSLINLVLNPSLWGSLSLISKITTVAGTAALAGIIVGSIWYKSDFLVYGGFIIIFLSYGASIFQFAQILQANPYFHDNPVIILITAPILIAYLYVLLKFWRGWD